MNTSQQVVGGRVTEKFANTVGRRLLRDEDFLDVLADVLDGVSVDFSDMTDDEFLSSGEEESDSDDETSSEEDESDEYDEEDSSEESEESEEVS